MPAPPAEAAADTPKAYPLQTIAFPGGVLASALLALNLLGDGLRDALDPRGGE